MTKNIPFRLIAQKEETNSLVVILPGAGYTTQAPLLHFTTGLFYNKGFDILHINYSFSRQEMAVLNDREFGNDIRRVIENTIKDKTYRHIYIVAKSIGTKALSYFLDYPFLKDAKLVWLTPILQNDYVFSAMLNSSNSGLCIVGEKDNCYVVERFEKLKRNKNLNLKVVEGGNHSLELDEDPIKSIEILKKVIDTINEF